MGKNKELSNIVDLLSCLKDFAFRTSFYSIMNKLMPCLLLSFSLIIFSGCKGGEGFSALEETIQGTLDEGDDDEEEPVEIISYSPTDSPVRVADDLETTFVVSVNPSAGSSLAYAWKLNGSLLSNQSSSFLQLNGSTTDPGLNTLEVVATNSVSSASKIFTLYKNTAPAIDTTSPGFTGNNVTCGGSNSITFEATFSDVDGDNLSPLWKLNGVPNHSSFSVSNTASSSTAIFSPPCSMAGPNIVSVTIDDGYESTSASWSVTIVNPLVAQIIGFTPIVSPVVIQENDSQLFTVSASGQAPFEYSWAINSDPGVSSGTTPSYTAAASSFPQPDGTTELGDHTFTVTVTDDNGSSDNHIFNVKINSVPTISNPVPSQINSKMNINSTRLFSVSVSDLNNDPLTYTWTLNGGAAPPGVFTGSGSSITFNPGDLQIGDNSIKVVVEDGFSLTEVSRVWNINVNHFSEECNALEAGQICTLVGPPGLGSDIDPVQNPQTAKIRPYDVINDGNDNYIILDTAQDVIWFYNTSSAPVDIIGTTVEAGKLKVIAGVGAYGFGTPGSIPTRYQMAEPTGIAWDSDRRDIYVSLRWANRIVRFTNAGSSQHVLCTGGGGNDNARNTEGGAATGHSCIRPMGLGIYNNGPTKRLYVANYDYNNIKYFDISDDNSSNWTGHLLICDKNGSGACQAGSTDGSTGDDSTARVNRPWGLHVDSNGLVFWTELSGCRVGVANPTSTTYNFYGGSVSLPPNTAKRIGGTGSCTTHSTANAYKLWNSQHLRQPFNITPYYNGSTYFGWFVSNSDHDVVTFFNTHSAPITIGGRQIDPNYSHHIWGNRYDGFNGDSQTATDTLLWYPWGLTMNNAKTKLILGDRDNYRLRTLDVSVNSGSTVTLISGKEKADFSGGANTGANTVLMNRPEGLFFDADNDIMLFNDRHNWRIRSINMKTGLENVVVGSGSSSYADTEQEDPTDVAMRYSNGILIHNNGVIYTDVWSGYGANRNSQIRVYNRNASPTNFFGTVVPAGKVSTIAGNFILGSQNIDNATWLSSYEGMNATSVSLGWPESLTTDGTNLYISDYYRHCILKIDQAGIVTTYAGQCGNNLHGYVNGTPFNDSTVRFRYPSQIATDPQVPGGLFIADQIDRTTSRIRYINPSNESVSIADQSVSPNTIATVFDSERTTGVAAFENWICFTSGHENRGDLGAHNVVCKDRTDAFGTTQFRIGPSGSADRGATQFAREEEGVPAPAGHLYGPRKIAFDDEGNLYITEASSHVIRFVKKWW